MELFEYINATIYENLELTLQKLDDRLDFKLYAFVLDEGPDSIRTVRVKSVLSDVQGQDSEIIQEKLNGPEEVLEKLGLALEDPDTDLEQFLIQLDATRFLSKLGPIGQLSEDTNSEDQAAIDSNGKYQHRQESNEWTIFYANSVDFEVENECSTIKYILSIENTDSITRSIFLERPQLSFLRMILDYYFKDYYKVWSDEELLFINEDQEIEIKYKENSSQFLQRMARLFFGKIQDIIINKSDRGHFSNADSELTETERNQYYVNNLFEKIDGISTRTYEGESPFGCMLLLNTSLLKDSKLVKYSIRFQDHQPIYLEDPRRIRKLLELTNNERDLYLIADDTAIYGVGEIDWGQLGDNLLFKVEFKGLSRYDLLLVTTEKKPNTDARIVTEVESKVFKMTLNLEIVSHKLTSISFKHPGIGSGGFTPELFERTLKAQFKDVVLPITDKEIEKLRLIIQKATEQQGGTMVVITDRSTAESELKKLRKQSTPILPTEINPIFIKHLASIDGAMYFDTTGACHAIGVILDGLAQDHLGDASRGARFHSAHRYLEKLKSEPDKKGCVIAIISEDGIINLIPEHANEAIVRKLVRAMLSYIQDNDELSEETLQDYASRLKEVENETAIDHHHYFKIAETFFRKNHFLKAAYYYDKGLKVCGHFILQYNRVLQQSYLRHALSDGITKDSKLQSYKDATEQMEIIFKMAKDDEISHEDYNRRALSLNGMGRLSDKKLKTEYFEKSLINFIKAIEMKKGNKYVLYRNRGYLYQAMGNLREALDDFISSEMELSEERTLDLIEKLIKQDVSLFPHAIASYSEKKNEENDSGGLTQLLMEYGAKLAEDHPEVAAALEQYGINQQQIVEE
ncbi:DNA integrity scanning protein DisA nucleotide-binding domain protein [Paenibacillus kribbensis]|uniref:DNA integrity scanning protein DisA nucleotide-binding domain protein n=1 Tax=Paenibacillus kribbensis TaxID=172713 RepID=UPI0015BA7671|nr:diadenylate cyclase [Paenibacillus kribbensis]